MDKQERLKILEEQLDSFKYADSWHAGDHREMAELRAEIWRLKDEIAEENRRKNDK